MLGTIKFNNNGNLNRDHHFKGCHYKTKPLKRNKPLSFTAISYTASTI